MNVLLNVDYFPRNVSLADLQKTLSLRFVSHKDCFKIHYVFVIPVARGKEVSCSVITDGKDALMRSNRELRTRWLAGGTEGHPMNILSPLVTFSKHSTTGLANVLGIW